MKKKASTLLYLNVQVYNYEENTVRLPLYMQLSIETVALLNL